MPHGQYQGPDKADKGQEGGSCNRSACQDAGADWYNHGSLKWYCERCMHDIRFDRFNLRDWERNHQPKCGHPMFETREMVNAREGKPLRHTGGTVSGRFSGSMPDRQELSYGGNQLRRDPDRASAPPPVFLNCDFAEIEKRIMGQIASEFGVPDRMLGKRK
jgi:hypothetical protein